LKIIFDPTRVFRRGKGVFIKELISLNQKTSTYAGFLIYSIGRLF
tara:strand:+ start:360 stop:494 length:135 start_codon:yes stop_codon:yes gene_type:complete